MLLPRASFAEKLKTGSYVDLHGFCKVVQVSAKGSRDDLEARLIAYHDDFTGAEEAGKSQMSQYLHYVSMNLPSVPAMPTFDIPTAARPQVQDPLLKSDPWKAFVGSPVRSQRGHDVHSGMTPQLQRERQKLTDFLVGTEASMNPIPAPPMPQNDDTALVLKALLDGQCALLQGVNDLRANVVTRQQLQTFHDLQATEMRTYVQAELASECSATTFCTCQIYGGKNGRN